MASASEMLKRLRSVSKITVLREMVYDEIKDNEHILKDLKKDEFEEGNINSNNNDWGYSKKFSTNDNREAGYNKYIDYKHALNPIAGYGRVDLINKGRFISSFYLTKPKQNKYLFGAKDPKLKGIENIYGDVRGLNQNTFVDFQIVYIKPKFVNRLKEIINKK